MNFILFLLPLLAGLWLIIKRRKTLNKKFEYLVGVCVIITGIIGVIVEFPQITYFLQNPDKLFSSQPQTQTTTPSQIPHGHNKFANFGVIGNGNTTGWNMGTSNYDQWNNISLTNVKNPYNINYSNHSSWTNIQIKNSKP